MTHLHSYVRRFCIRDYALFKFKLLRHCFWKLNCNHEVKKFSVETWAFYTENSNKYCMKCVHPLCHRKWAWKMNKFKWDIAVKLYTICEGVGLWCGIITSLQTKPSKTRLCAYSACLLCEKLVKQMIIHA